jgi:hypothetical protein
MGFSRGYNVTKFSEKLTRELPGRRVNQSCSELREFAPDLRIYFVENDCFR